MANLDMCKGVDGTMFFIRDGAGKLWKFDGVRAAEPSAADLRLFVSIRRIQIKSQRGLFAALRSRPMQNKSLKELIALVRAGSSVCLPQDISSENMVQNARNALDELERRTTQNIVERLERLQNDIGDFHARHSVVFKSVAIRGHKIKIECWNGDEIQIDPGGRPNTPELVIQSKGSMLSTHKPEPPDILTIVFTPPPGAPRLRDSWIPPTEPKK